MVVVGGRHSANTCRLAELAAQQGPRVLHIETDAELRKSDFHGCTTVGVTAGASTPEWMINRVVEKIEAFDPETTSRLNTWLKRAMGLLVASNVYVGLGAASLTLAASLLLQPSLSREALVPLMSTAGLFILAMHTVNRYQERAHYRAAQNRRPAPGEQRHGNRDERRVGAQAVRAWHQEQRVVR